MGVLFLGFCFPFGLLVFVAWISGSQHDLSSGREPLSKLVAELLAFGAAGIQPELGDGWDMVV